MSKIKNDLIGLPFGRLTPLCEFGKNKHGEILWLCECSCGNFKIIPRKRVAYGKTQSCGCLQRESIKATGHKMLDPNGLNNHLFVYKLQGKSKLRGIFRPCSNCGKMSFVLLSDLKTQENTFCSIQCSSEFKKTGRYKICPICGKEFWAMKSTEDRGKGVYCSIECMAKGKTTRVKKTCLQCGKEFETYQCQIQNNHGNYCSLKCYGGSQRKEVEITCQWCGKKINVKEHYVKRGQYKYCSRECAAKANSGENCHLWQGGKSFEPYCPKFNNAKKEETRNKFDRKCLICGKSEEDNGKKLSVHHVNYDKMQGCDGKQWDLVPLCLSCHSRLHASSDQEYWTNLIRHIISCRVIST